ncbi:MAG: hypothetical protein K2P48_02580 [Lachnospiraceae bacterium]|nr:hypothetical protein [Lachnospiraceae bacterium]
MKRIFIQVVMIVAIPDFIQRGIIMKTADYLNQLLRKYSGTFDLYQPYVIHGKEYPAYGYFFSHTEKYVLVREANMWSADSYEHVLFITAQEVDQALIEEAEALVRNYMEPVLVRKGEALPAQGHMYSYLTISLIVQRPLSKQMQKAVRRFRFEKCYRFNVRGFSQAHIVCATMEDERVYTNYVGRKAANLYQNIFREQNIDNAAIRS